MQDSSNYSHYINPTCFREYDIRGLVGKALFAQDAYYIGKAIATEVIRSSNIHKICVGYDGRLSSILFLKELVQGIINSGVDVLDVGLCPTPMLYYSTHTTEIPHGVMITGSHNPADYNGFKIVINKQPFFGQDIQKLSKAIINSDFARLNKSSTKYNDIRIVDYYIKSMISSVNFGNRPLKIVWDVCNGSASVVVSRMVKVLPGSHFILNGQVDGLFPGHDPDPTIPKNLRQIIEFVLKENCDFGIALDGDADRIVVIDNTGTIISGDKLTYLYAEHIVNKIPAARVIVDIKTSQAIFDELMKLGIIATMWKTGHSNIKNKMIETKAVLAGEVSGHIFFADKYYGFDDGIYAGLRMMEIMSSVNKSLDEMMNKIPETLISPEYRIHCPDDRKFEVIREIKARLIKEEVAFVDIDGVRVNMNEGWWLIRASNTEPALVLRYEALDNAFLKVIQQKIKEELIASNVTVSIAL